MSRTAVAGVPTGNGRMLSHCLEFNATGRVGGTSVFGGNGKGRHTWSCWGAPNPGALPQLWNPLTSRAD